MPDCACVGREPVAGQAWRRESLQRLVSLGYTNRAVSGTDHLGSTNEFVGFDSRYRSKASPVYVRQRGRLHAGNLPEAECSSRVGRAAALFIDRADTSETAVVPIDMRLQLATAGTALRWRRLRVCIWPIHCKRRAAQ